MNRLEARYIGIVVERDGEYNGIPYTEAVRQIALMPKIIQNEFVEGMLRQRIDTMRQSRERTTQAIEAMGIQ